MFWKPKPGSPPQIWSEEAGPADLETSPNQWQAQRLWWAGCNLEVGADSRQLSVQPVTCAHSHRLIHHISPECKERGEERMVEVSSPRRQEISVTEAETGEER